MKISNLATCMEIKLTYRPLIYFKYRWYFLLKRRKQFPYLTYIDQSTVLCPTSRDLSVLLQDTLRRGTEVHTSFSITWTTLIPSRTRIPSDKRYPLDKALKLSLPHRPTQSLSELILKISNIAAPYSNTVNENTDKASLTYHDTMCYNLGPTNKKNLKIHPEPL